MQFVTYTDHHGVEVRRPVHAVFWSGDVQYVVTDRPRGMYDTGSPFQVIGIDPDQTTHHEMGRTEYLSFDGGQ